MIYTHRMMKVDGLNPISMLHEKAPAKFNRFLSVLNRRSDGFHTVEMVTAVLHDWPSLTDHLSVEPSADFGLEIVGPASGGLLPDASNLVVKAWALLEMESDRDLPARVVLFKNIPNGAGLGGGSSDAAAALRAGNRLFNLGLSNSTLLRLAAVLGNDVPLFLLGGTVFGIDLGQRVFPLRNIPLPPMLIAYPNLHVSTSFVYNALIANGLSNNTPCPALSDGTAPPWRNDLTSAALAVCPELAQVRDALVSEGGEPLLCGSGSSWAAKFKNIGSRDIAVEKLSLAQPGWCIFTEG